jgi:5,10-methylene-tetrahydrofolate dehydrogenase/methenyl tetrahydrofolate cyclohydrolase
MIVQLPLPDFFDTEQVLAAVTKEKDVDGISPNFEEKDRLVRAPVAVAIDHILRSCGISPAGKKAVVVGYGRLVGKPVMAMLHKMNADVQLVTQEDGSLDDLKDADIVVLGAGNPGFVKPDHLKKDVVLIDAGTSESGGKVVGDADPKCADVSSVFTPVPGGVGPLAVAMIFKNLFDLVEVKK